MNTKKYKEALKVWDDILNNTEDTNIKVIASIGKAESLAFQKKYVECLKILSSLKDRKEYSKILYLETARVAEESGDIKKAIWAYEELKSSTQSLMDPNEMFYDYKIIQLKEKL
jgi:DNA-binding SARP family transcriptional activator